METETVWQKFDYPLLVQVTQEENIWHGNLKLSYWFDSRPGHVFPPLWKLSVSQCDWVKIIKVYLIVVNETVANDGNRDCLTEVWLPVAGPGNSIGKDLAS